MTQENSTKKWSGSADRSETDSSQALGVYLQRQRQRKQQSIDEVAAATRIPRQTLQALEAGDKEQLPVSVFTKGFVKLYAKHLNLDQVEILDRFDNEWGNVQSAAPEILSGESMAESSPFFLSLRFYFSLSLMALVVSLAYFFFQADDTPPPAALTTIPLPFDHQEKQVVVKEMEVKKLNIPAPSTNQETLLVSPQSAGKIALEPDEEDRQGDSIRPQQLAQQAEASTPVQPDRAGQENIGPREPPLPAPLSIATAQASVSPATPPTEAGPAVQPEPPSPAGEEVEPPPALQAVNLHIRFLKRTRISVSQDDGQPAKYIFAPGEESSWQAASHITLHVDTGDAVELTVNGAPLPVASESGPLAITLPTDTDR